ncbi:MAG: hypothetical protein ACLR23_12320 [Clostridia bacterium]
MQHGIYSAQSDGDVHRPEIYAVPMTDSDWGVDYLEDEALEDGDDREILLDAQQCWRYWKLKLVDEYGGKAFGKPSILHRFQRLWSITMMKAICV